MNNAVSRFAYRLLLRLHPAPFQHEFGAEMLWIFDEEFQRGASSYLRRRALSPTPALQDAAQVGGALHSFRRSHQHSGSRPTSPASGWNYVLRDSL
jgi:hypothetical protein